MADDDDPLSLKNWPTAEKAEARMKAQKPGAKQVIRHENVEPTLWVTDAELIRRLGVPEKIAYAAIHVLDRELHRGFPQKQRLWASRRYWPAVKARFDLHYAGPASARRTL